MRGPWGSSSASLRPQAAQGDLGPGDGGEGRLDRGEGAARARRGRGEGAARRVPSGIEVEREHPAETPLEKMDLCEATRDRVRDLARDVEDSAAYAALAVGGRFKGMIDETPEGLLIWIGGE